MSGLGTGGSRTDAMDGKGAASGDTDAFGGSFGTGAAPDDNSSSGSGDLGGTPGSGGSGATGGTDSPAPSAAGESGAPTSNGEGGASPQGEAGSSASGAAGTSEPAPGVCGDGIVDPNEACDDGNLAPDDGCADDCTVEHGFVCGNAQCKGNDCTLRLPATFRDFNGSTQIGGHPDFQPGYNSSGAVQGAVEPDLDADGKPVLSSAASATNGFFHGPAAFAEWYRDDPPSGGAIPGEMILWDDGSGQGRYVNRFGAHGEQWQAQQSAASYGAVTYGGPAGGGCQACAPSATGACYDPCIPWGEDQYACCAEQPRSSSFDGTPLFFPIDTGPNLLDEPRSAAQIATQYGWSGVPLESTVATALGITTPEQTAWAPFPSTAHNFSFTTEIKYWFRYAAGRKYTFELGSDDDSWLFSNGRLALDLGGFHAPLDASATLELGTLSATVALSETDDGTPVTVATSQISAKSLGLENGQVYSIAIFAAEREVEGSAFKFAIGGIDGTVSTCAPER